MHYIDGIWVEGVGESFTSIDPSTKEVNWTGTHATSTELKEAVSTAQKAFSSWSSLSTKERINYLEHYAAKLKEEQKNLAEVISKETGKPFWETLSEVSTMIQKIPLSIEAYKERCPDRKIGHLTTHHIPHGVVVVIGPFNFPCHLPNGHIVPALLAGNTVIFKPSMQTPLSGEAMVKCWDLPPGVLNLLQGGSELGRSLAKHPDINGLFFTGSYQTGLHLMETFSHHPEKILALEMGGNNPLVVSDVSDLEAAAYLTIQSAYITAGQRCSCARRLIVPKGHEGDEFLKVLSHMVESIQVGKYTDRPEPFIGPVISLEVMENLLTSQAKLGAAGGKPLVEMKQLTEGFPFLSPGLMDVTEVANRPDEELFGPFLQVIRVTDFEQAIQEANKTEYGLTAALLSRSRDKFSQFFQEVKAGVINWNSATTGASSQAPFGGVGKSGNHRPSAYYAADYCAYPVTSLENPEIHLPKTLTPGITFLAKS